MCESFVRRARTGLIRFAPTLALRWLVCGREELAWLGECLAARAILRTGARLLGRRAHLGGVEVDLVVRDAREFVCVEVKTSTARQPGEAVRWRPAHRVDRARIERQQRAASALARLRPHGECRVRCDVIEVWVDPVGKRFWIQRHRGVTTLAALPRDDRGGRL